MYRWAGSRERINLLGFSQVTLNSPESRLHQNTSQESLSRRLLCGIESQKKGSEDQEIPGKVCQRARTPEARSASPFTNPKF